MTSKLLNLPTEVLINIFENLNIRDVVQVQAVCQKLKQIYDDSSSLQYYAELEVAGMLDNPYCTIPVAEKLSKLRQREERWANLDPDFVSSTQTLRTPSGVYDVTPTTYLLGIALSRDAPLTAGLQSVRLPSSPSESQASFTQIDIPPKNIVDFGTSIEEHDLLVVLSVQLGVTETLDHQYFLEVALLRHSTGSAHDEAENPVLFLQDIEHLCSVSIEISGENLAISVQSRAEQTATLHIFNWRKGTRKADSRTVQNLGLVFLRDDLLLIPDTEDECLDIFHVPYSRPGVDDSSLDMTPLAKFRLPETAEGNGITSLQCRCDPSPTAGGRFPKYTPKDRPFANDPNQAVMILEMRIGLDLGALRLGQAFVMFVHRAALLRLLPEVGDPQEHRVIDWNDWGPSHTRWLDADGFSSVYITSTAGQRFVSINKGAQQNASPIRVLDFNPYHVRKALADVSPSDTIIEDLLDDSDEGGTCNGKGVFKNTVLESELPYVQLTTESKVYDYHAVLVDEQRIIGLRYQTGDEWKMDRTIEFLHYG